MPHNLPESDWKVFRDLRATALDRFCRRVLAETERVSADTTRTAHERYLAICQLIRERDQELSRAFDAPGRSRALQQLASIHALGLLEPEELKRLTAETREAVLFLSGFRAEEA